MADKSSIKIRTKTTNGITTVSVMMRHPMETGRRKDPETGEVIPMQHIQQVTCQLNGETVMSAVIGAGISTNPFFSFNLQDAKAGDILELGWHDNLDNSDRIKTVIK